MFLRRLLFSGISRYCRWKRKRLWPSVSWQVSCTCSFCDWDNLKRKMFPCHSIFWQYLKIFDYSFPVNDCPSRPAKSQSHLDRRSGFEGRWKNSRENFFSCKVLLAVCCCRLLCKNLFLIWRCEITAFEICSSVDFCCALEEWKKTREVPNITFYSHFMCL